MKTQKIVRIGKTNFEIEESAYQIYRNYMLEMSRYFANTKQRKEIVEELENKIADVLNSYLPSRYRLVEDADMNMVINLIGTEMLMNTKIEEEVIAEEIKAPVHTKPMDNQTIKKQTNNELKRDPNDLILGGVCSGLGKYFGIPGNVLRLLFVLGFIFYGTGILLYGILWIALPLAPRRYQISNSTVEQWKKEMGQKQYTANFAK